MTLINAIHYTIHLEPNLTSFKFDGRAEIQIESESPISEIKLNAHKLAIWSCSIEDSSKYTEVSFSVCPKEQEITITLPDERKGQIKLKIEYIGEINSGLVGFYRSKYQIENQTRYVAVTQFEETYARQAFPCFDHPSKKATFDIEFVIDKDLTAIANTLLKEEKELEGDKKLVIFETTPKMSTYLLFFGIGEWEYIEDKHDNRVYRLATTPGKTQYGQFGLDFSKKAVIFGETYTGIKYPIGKMDQIAVSDFAFGAMENYGAVTYRENLLLVYPGITSSAGIEGIAEIISHEIAHMWFGNLVSPLDWKYIWLNESFATLFGYAIADHYHPEWNIWDQFLGGEVVGAFERDSLIETFPIELTGEGEAIKITAATAPIIYNKGAAILQMVRGYLGEDAFKKGINHFLNKYAFTCATSDNCWEAFEEATNEPFKALMTSWVHQAGYPFIEATRNGDELILTQQRFTYNPFQSDQTWLIPVTISFFDIENQVTQEKILFKDKTIKISVPSNTVCFKLNIDQTGFYRVKYDDENLKCLGELAQKKILSAKDRYGLLTDFYAFVRRGDCPIGAYIYFLDYFKSETEYLPLVEIAGALSHAYDIIESKREVISVKGFELLSGQLQEIGYEPKENEIHTTSLLRSALMWPLHKFSDENLDTFGLKMFQSLKEEKEVHPDILSIVMRLGASLDNSSYNWFINRFESPKTEEQDRINILGALGSFNDKELLKKMLSYVIEHVPEKNKFIPIIYASRNLAIVEDLWPWFFENREKLEKMHFTLYERIITSVIYLSGLEREVEVKKFFEEYMEKNTQVKDTIKMALERLEINSRLRKS